MMPEHTGIAKDFAAESADSVAELREHSRDLTNTLITIGGGSASGKSTLAENVAEELDAVILHMDDFWREDALEIEEDYDFNFDGPHPIFDHPDSIDWPLLRNTIEALVLGDESAERPIWSFDTLDREGYEIVEPADYVIVEGLYAAADHYPLNARSLNVFVDVPAHERLVRRLKRDVGNRIDSFEGALEWWEQSQAAHPHHVEPTKQNADIVLHGDEKSEADGLLGVIQNL